MRPGESKKLTGYEVKHRTTITFSEEVTKALVLIVILLSLLSGSAEKLMIKPPWKHNEQQGFGV